MRLFVVVLLAGCGRMHFDELGAVAGDSAQARPCGVPETAPPTVMIGGQTFEYTSFDNMKQPVAAVGVMALDAADGTPIASVISGTDGAYAVDVTTGAAPSRIALRYATTGYFATTAIADLEIAASTMGAGLPVWSFGDAPIWSNTTMGTFYSMSGVTRDPGKGTLNVAVRDCSGTVVEGVSVTIDPPPGTVRYQAVDGRPSTTLTATELPFGHVFALNAEPGATKIIATKPGRTFLETDAVVLGGLHNTLVIVRAID